MCNKYLQENTENWTRHGWFYSKEIATGKENSDWKSQQNKKSLEFMTIGNEGIKE